MIRPSDLDAVAEGEADAAVGVDCCMIQQLSPGFWVECRHLLRKAAQGTDELLRSGLGRIQRGDLLSHFIVLGLDAVVPVDQVIVPFLVFGLVEGNVGVFVDRVLHHLCQHAHLILG